MQYNQIDRIFFFFFSFCDLCTMGKYKRKSTRELKFTQEILNQAAEPIANGESKRLVAKSLDVNECTLTKRLRKVIFYRLNPKYLHLNFFCCYRVQCLQALVDLSRSSRKIKKNNWQVIFGIWKFGFTV